jgi:hypothetical protein
MLAALLLVALGLAAVAVGLFTRREPTQQPQAQIVYQGALNPEAPTGGPEGAVPTPPPAETNVVPTADPDPSKAPVQHPTPRKREAPAPSSRAGCAARKTLAARNQCVINGHSAAFRSCLDRHASEISGSPELTLRFSLAASGKISSIELGPESAARTPLGACVVAEARKIAFGNQGKPVLFRIPLKIRKR